MANCNHLFGTFYNNLQISNTKEKNLTRGRQAVREKIENHFIKNLSRKKPEFLEQGSYAQDTIINPPKGGEYDLDDGVYLQDLDRNDKTRWPKPEEVHSWVFEAIKDHADDREDRDNCVRVIYKNDYHIDLPIYAEQSGIPHIAIKGKGWYVNDPGELTDWIIDKINEHGEQLRRFIRYLKAWKDEQNKKSKMPNGLYISILCIEEYLENDRDDLGMQLLVDAIKRRIQIDDEVKNPINDGESLTDRLSGAQRKTFKERLDKLSTNANKAIIAESEKEACILWRGEFGEYFPACEDCKDKGGYTPRKKETVIGGGRFA